MKIIKKFFRLIGPGVITGAADDDPSGIATYSQAGAQFGYGQLWILLFILPLQTAIQEACARIGLVTGKGVAAVIKEHYNKKILYGVVLLIFIANTINIGADIGALAAAFNLIIPINIIVLTLLFTILILSLEIFIPYNKYANILKWLCLSLIAYPATVFITHAPWKTLLKATFIPHIEYSFQFLFIIIGVLGTTISPYLFFWEASQEVEEEHKKHLPKYNGVPKVSCYMLKKMRIDNFIGMFFSQITAWSIMVVSAVVLHTSGIIDIKTAADAAKALEPLVHTFAHAGYIAKLIFATGIIGLGLLAIPILAGSVAYAFGEAFNWRVGLNLKFNQAQGFYGVIIIATCIGLLMNFIGINPIKALIYAAVINGVVAVPLIFLIGLITQNKKIMNGYQSGLLSNIFVWITFISMAIAAAGMFVAFLK